MYKTIKQLVKLDLGFGRSGSSSFLIGEAGQKPGERVHFQRNQHAIYVGWLVVLGLTAR